MKDSPSDSDALLSTFKGSKSSGIHTWSRITPKKAIIVLSLATLASIVVFKLTHPTTYVIEPLDVINGDLVPADDVTKRGVNVTVDDVALTIKTSKKFHTDRVDLILKTWFKKANGQVFFITDDEDAEYQQKTGGKMVVSQCGKTHGLRALCCKNGMEFDTFMATKKTWWCHFDDDDYVNVENLVTFLNKFDPRLPHYIGRRSVDHFQGQYKFQKYNFNFATGGAGVCISRPLAEKMKEWTGEHMARMCTWINYADDCTVGFIVTALLRIAMTESLFFHSHIEHLADLDATTLKDQICLSYRSGNVLNLDPIRPRFNVTLDPTRMLSLHCHIYPDDVICT